MKVRYRVVGRVELVSKHLEYTRASYQATLR